jgi:hypothetical protein
VSLARYLMHAAKRTHRIVLTLLTRTGTDRTPIDRIDRPQWTRYVAWNRYIPAIPFIDTCGGRSTLGRS